MTAYRIEPSDALVVVVDLFHRYLKQDYIYNDIGIEMEGGA